MRFPANASFVTAPSFVFANAAAAHGYLAIFAFTCSISARLRNRLGCVTGAARVASEQVNARMHNTSGMTLRGIRFLLGHGNRGSLGKLLLCPIGREHFVKNRTESKEVRTMIRFFGNTLLATSRFNRVSRARKTSPIPPTPMATETAYGPIRYPECIVVRAREVMHFRATWRCL